MRILSLSLGLLLLNACHVHTHAICTEKSRLAGLDGEYHMVKLTKEGESQGDRLVLKQEKDGRYSVSSRQDEKDDSDTEFRMDICKVGEKTVWEYALRNNKKDEALYYPMFAQKKENGTWSLQPIQFDRALLDKATETQLLSYKVEKGIFDGIEVLRVDNSKIDADALLALVAKEQNAEKLELRPTTKTETGK